MHTDRLLLSTARAVRVLLHRELAADESARIGYGSPEAIGTPPRDLVEALRDLDASLGRAQGVPS